mgnify:FL=1
MENKKLFLLDAYALIFRAYHALKYQPRITSKGMNTSAIFGFVNTLEEVLKKENPTHIAVCFDPAGKTFRHEMYEEYKAGREATPEDIKIAIPYIKDIIRAYRIPIVEVPGYEADDVIGTLARKSVGLGYDTYIMSPDKDLGQLVSETVKIFRPGIKGNPPEIRGIAEVCSIFGVNEPKQIIDLLALMGDKVDNIPGCPGVGEVTASKLILEFGSVENIIANTDKLKGALKKKIESNVESIRFSRTLTEIHTDAPIEINEEDLRRKEMDVEALRAIFNELEFRTLSHRILGDKAETVAPKVVKPVKKAETYQPSLFDDLLEPAVEEVQLTGVVSGKFVFADDGNYKKLLEDAAKKERAGVYFVTTNAESMLSELKGMAVATSAKDGFYVEYNDDRKSAFANFLGSSVEKVGADLKHSIIVLSRLGIEFAAPFYDTSIAHYLLQPEMSHALDRLSEIYLEKELPQIELPQGTNVKKFDYAVSLAAADYFETVCSYASANLQLSDKLNALLEKEGMCHLLNDIEFPLIQVLADMEMSGVRIDEAALKAYSVSLTERLDNIERECLELAGKDFNVSSPAQVGEVLFEHLKIDAKAKKTARGQYSTTEEVLEKLRDRHPIVGKILEYRKIKKLLSTYVNALPDLINPKTGRIHTTYNQTVTATGRLSSTNPNLQNIPIRNEEGREIRKAFIPADGNVFFSADYSQIELRLVANMSEDESMVEAFLAGNDIHRATAAKIFHEKLEDVTEDQRRKAKTANFGMIYGISAFGLSERLKISRAEAKSIIEGYFAMFPGVRKYMDECVEKTKSTGYVTTLFGRRRLLPDINSRNAVVRGYAERNAINAPIQGTAADVIKIAMINIYKKFKEEGIRSKMILQVHDELNFDVLPEELEKVETIVKSEMESAAKFRVPLVADCGKGDNWLEAH